MREIIVEASKDITICTNVIFDEMRKHGKLRVTVAEYVEGDESRSVKQNKLAFYWYKHVAVTTGEYTAEQVRAFCKLHFGVAIRKEDEKFRDAYDRVVKPLSYENKLEIMGPPIEFPITSDFSTKEMTRYLDAIYVHYAGIGIDLPQPENLYDSAMGISKKKPEK
jgi:hypothetical protein